MDAKSEGELDSLMIRSEPIFFKPNWEKSFNIQEDQGFLSHRWKEWLTLDFACRNAKLLKNI